MHSPPSALLAQFSSFHPNSGARETMMEASQTPEMRVQMEAELREWM